MCVCVSVCVTWTVVSHSWQPPGLWPTRIICPWNFPGKNTRVDCRFLLQKIFSTQRLNLRLWYFLHWQVDSLPLGSHLGSCTAQCYPTLKRNELSSHEKTWRKLRCVSLSERRQSEKSTYVWFQLHDILEKTKQNYGDHKKSSSCQGLEERMTRNGAKWIFRSVKLFWFCNDG